MKKTKITMQDIADKLGISKNAVSLALANKPGVSEETKELVFHMAKKLGYEKAQNRNVTSNKILVLIPEYIRNDNYFYNQIYWAIEERAKQKGFIAIMASISAEMESTVKMPEVFKDIEFAGVILVGVVSNEYARFVERVSQNLVFVDNSYWGMNVDCVVTSNIDAGYQLTKYLIEKHHNVIGFVGSVSKTASLFERWCGYKCATQEAGLPPMDDVCILDPSPLKNLLSDAGELKEKIQALPRIPTAFVCGGDRIAVATVEALKRLGYQVPQEVSVVGIDDIEVAQIIEPALTTVRINRSRMGVEAVDLLLKHMNRKHTKVRIELYTEIVERKSVAEIQIENGRNMDT